MCEVFWPFFFFSEACGVLLNKHAQEEGLFPEYIGATDVLRRWNKENCHDRSDTVNSSAVYMHNPGQSCAVSLMCPDETQSES